ncbi:hypothetical protein B0H13DRAFT_949860 [Mycena leptocephala]|nr:hypothetical protein B0H13DRAFT_949860 [Mycena leptocephala]
MRTVKTECERSFMSVAATRLPTEMRARREPRSRSAVTRWSRYSRPPPPLPSSQAPSARRGGAHARQMRWARRRERRQPKAESERCPARAAAPHRHPPPRGPGHLCPQLCLYARPCTDICTLCNPPFLRPLTAANACALPPRPVLDTSSSHPHQNPSGMHPRRPIQIRHVQVRLATGRDQTERGQRVRCTKDVRSRGDRDATHKPATRALPVKRQGRAHEARHSRGVAHGLLYPT